MTEFKHALSGGKNYTADDIKALIKENDVQFIQLQFVDINGQVKNMGLPPEQIDRILNNEIMLDGSSIKGFRSIETSDMYFFPDKNSFQVLPWTKGNARSARLICDIHNPDALGGLFGVAGYPRPMVDLSKSRERALAAFKNLEPVHV